ncbi:MAG TPA: gliding motility lipoprotein GldB [Adhaeribacter sp.]|nr:gliding motility lipoprotein GldB [Adhaeribacter sp.]
MRIPILLLCTLFLAFGCQKNKCEIPEEISNIKVDIKAQRLEKELFSLKSEAEVQDFLNKHPLFANRFLHRNRYPDDQELVKSLYGMASEPHLRQLVQETDERFKDMEDLENDLETAYKHLKYYYPEEKVPQLATFVTGMGQDLYLDDSLVVWGLEFFIGPTAKYRPPYPKYILYRYDKPYVIPTTVLLLSNRFNQTDPTNNTMLAEMISNGKSLYFAQKMLPCTPESLLIGYTNQQMADVYHNQDQVWAHFVEKNLLYETNQFQIKKYVGERPNVPEIGKQAPGRIGVWLGWQIVRKYMEDHPEITLPQLMAESNPQKILTQSKYKPKKRN